MALKTRITLLFLLAAAAWIGLAGAFSAWRESAQAQRYHASLQQGLSAAWGGLEVEALAEIGETIEDTLEGAAWRRAWRQNDRDGLQRVLHTATGDLPHWHAELYDETGRLVMSTFAGADSAPMMAPAEVLQTLADNRPWQGLTQVARRPTVWVVGRPFRHGRSRGLLAIGLDAATRLGALRSPAQGEFFLLSLRGRLRAGTEPALFEQLQPELRVRRADALELRGPDGRTWQAISTPLVDRARRPVGALLALHDITGQQAQERLALQVAAGFALVLMAALALGLFRYARYLFSPLERSVVVLRRLSRGDLEADLGDEDEAQPGEAGQIARGVAALRLEMLNLRTLREERTRAGEQQERLIRTQLMALADNVDPSARQEILQALAPSAPAGDEAPGGSLAELAHILARLSGLVSAQQNRLVDLLRELQASMQQQALLAGLQQEIDIARRMQQAILPRRPPDTPAVSIAATMVPAREIGGDFYDYFLIDADHLAVVVADVSGKGVPAAFFMAISRTLLKANALLLRSPAAALARLNDQLCEDNDQMMFVTVFLAVLDLRSGELVHVNAGHNPPLVRHLDGRVERLASSTGRHMALAVMEGQAYGETHSRLAPGETLVLYTDGVTEATNLQGKLWGEPALTAWLGQAAPEASALPEAVLGAVRAFEAGAAQADDITCVAVHFHGPAR